MSVLGGVLAVFWRCRRCLRLLDWQTHDLQANKKEASGTAWRTAIGSKQGSREKAKGLVVRCARIHEHRALARHEK